MQSLWQRNAQRSTFNESSESEAKLVPLKSSAASIMHACESLAAGACRNRYLRHHVRDHQWATTEDSAVKSVSLSCWCCDKKVMASAFHESLYRAAMR